MHGFQTSCWSPSCDATRYLSPEGTLEMLQKYIGAGLGCVTGTCRKQVIIGTYTCTSPYGSVSPSQCGCSIQYMMPSFVIGIDWRFELFRVESTRQPHQCRLFDWFSHSHVHVYRVLNKDCVRVLLRLLLGYLSTIYVGHVFFTDLGDYLPPATFTRPAYVNWLRDPVERYISQYYFWHTLVDIGPSTSKYGTFA